MGPRIEANNSGLETRDLRRKGFTLPVGGSKTSDSGPTQNSSRFTSLPLASLDPPSVGG